MFVLSCVAYCPSCLAGSDLVRIRLLRFDLNFALREEIMAYIPIAGHNQIASTSVVLSLLFWGTWHCFRSMTDRLKWIHGSFSPLWCMYHYQNSPSQPSDCSIAQLVPYPAPYLVYCVSTILWLVCSHIIMTIGLCVRDR
ncbi:MAG: hypothetical protein J3R72DRAFT_133210 [Linnemannia gamsii]|nr:MAG: hypothetical protein J3R72DRAFT_133210 [Linnemannia gamsii]